MKVIKLKDHAEWAVYSLLWVFFAVLLLLLIWGQPYFPSQDGPSHLYNAWVMKVLGNPEFPLITSSYCMRWSLFPNWAGHAVMFSLLYIFSPITAEKIWISLIVLGLPSGIIFLARSVAIGIKNPSVPWWTLLAFFFALNQSIFRGFYNHGMGMVIFVFCLAYYWKNNIRGWTAFRFLILNILLVISYFCHIVPFLLSLAAIAILQLSNRESILNSLRFFIGLVPTGLLLIYYKYSYPIQYRLRLPGVYYFKKEALYILQGKMLVGFDYHDNWYITFMALLGIGIIGMFLAALIGYRSSIQGDTRNRLIILTLVLLGIYFISPDKISGGKYLTMRLALYPLFPLIVWLKAPRNILLRIMLICSILILNLAHFEQSLTVQKEINNHYKRIVCLAKTIPEGSFIATSRNFQRWNHKIRPILHAVSYGIIGRDIVNLVNYEARLPYFPVKWKRKPELKWPIYSLTLTAHDYSIYRQKKSEFIENLFYSGVLTNN